MLHKIFIPLVCLAFSSSAFARTLHINPTRTINIIDVVDVEILKEARELDKMSTESADPIYLVVNSPGGAVNSGTVFLDAMAMAQARGVELRCVSGILAASMAFHILARCDKRYAFANTKLLFHPVRIFAFGQILTPAITLSLYKDLQRVETHLSAPLIKALKMSEKEFKAHNEAETMWFGEELAKRGFLTLVQNVVGTKNILVHQRQNVSPMTQQIRDILQESMPSLFSRGSAK